MPIQHTASRAGRTCPDGHRPGQFYVNFPSLHKSAQRLSDADYLADIRAIKADLVDLPPGLSLAHIWPQEHQATARVALGGRVMRAHAPSAALRKSSPFLVKVPAEGAELRGRLMVRSADGDWWVQPARKVILGFSHQSRMRLLQRINGLDRRRWKVPPVMVTLTYPGQWPKGPRVWKRHLQAFRKRLEREYGPIPAFWKMEFQERGAPHFHLLAYDARARLCAHAFKRWLTRNWYEVVNSGDERHRRAGTNVEIPHSRRKMEAYATKYVGKPEEGQEGAGRYWGVWHEDLLPRAILEVALELHEFHVMNRAIRRLLRSRGVRPGRSVFVDDHAGLQLVHYCIGGLSPPAEREAQKTARQRQGGMLWPLKPATIAAADAGLMSCRRICSGQPWPMGGS